MKCSTGLAFALLIMLGAFFGIRGSGPRPVGAQDQTTTIGPVMVSSAVTPLKVHIDVLGLPEAPPTGNRPGRGSRSAEYQPGRGVRLQADFND